MVTKTARWWRTLNGNIKACETELAKRQAQYETLGRIIRQAEAYPHRYADDLIVLAGRVASLKTELAWLHQKKGDALGQRLLAKRAHDNMQRIVSEIVDAAHANQGDANGKKEGSE